MRKNTVVIFVLILILNFVSACRQKIKFIPEITPHITEEIIFDLKDKEAVGKIIKSDAKLIFVTLKGEIFRFDPAKRILDFMVNFNIEVDPEIFHQDDFIVLKRRDKNNYIIFNLTGMRIEKKLDDIQLAKIIGVDDNLLIYRDKNELVFLDYKSGETKKKLEIGEKVNLFNSESTGSAFFILTDDILYIYKKKNDSIESLEMKIKPTSGFLIDEEYIYYGSRDRKLIKFSLKSRKIKWNFKLPTILKLKPQKIGNYILITPEDNNIYFFTTKGSLHWWTSLDSPRAIPAVIMKKNAAVFLMNREYRWMNNKIRFFNYKKKEVVSYEFKYQMESNPVYLDNYLYILCKDEEEEVKNISLIGNKYDVEVEIEPQSVKPLGKSITFKIKPINLIEPSAKIKILDESQNSIFTKEIGKGADLSFVYIPEKVGEYKCVVEVGSENKKDIKAEEDFKVVDIDSIVKEYYFELFKNCPKVFPKEKKEKKDIKKEVKEEVEKSGKLKNEGEEEKKKKNIKKKRDKKKKKGEGREKNSEKKEKVEKKKKDEIGKFKRTPGQKEH